MAESKFATPQGETGPRAARLAVGPKGREASFRVERGGDGKFGVVLEGAGMASARQPRPVQLEWFDGKTRVVPFAAGYDRVRVHGDGAGARIVGVATVAHPNGGSFEFEDRWSVEDGALVLARRVVVRHSAEGGFLSGFTWQFDGPRKWTDAEWFAPGMIYGGFAHLTDTAIGGRAHYKGGDRSQGSQGEFTVRIREDRLPAPLFGARFADGRSLAVLDAAPDGSTPRADARDVAVVPLVDERIRVGALGGQQRGDRLELGGWFPGSEGESTYQGNTYPGGQLHRWRLRFHPIRAGLVQSRRLASRLGADESFPQFFAAAWRWAFSTLRPQVVWHDIPKLRREIVDMLADRVRTIDGRSGIPTFIDAVRGEKGPVDERAILGFCGKCLEAAEMLLAEAADDPSPRGARLRRLGEAIIATFLKLRVDPPAGEGFHLKTGQPICALPGNTVYLRSFGDDVKALLRAYRREKAAGRERPEWLAWARRFADWLLTQQQPGGGFPRSWAAPSGKVVSASPNASYNAVPLLAILFQITGQAKYKDAACRAAEFCWAHGQSSGRFVGGTIDNPDVLDKEAATLSLEAYLALHDVTRESKWLDRAVAAAQFAETWIYCWNVPMADDENNAELAWKRGVSTAGLQLIASGHSLTDCYMAYDVDEFAALHRRTGDAHFLDIARLLLHNTKGMTATSGRTFDLAGPGSQQEHWSVAPHRGFGLHRGWLPWVSTSQLNGIIGLKETDRELYAQLTAPPAAPTTYTNPVIAKPTLADPTVLLHEGTYYLYPTDDSRGYDVYTSKDLVRWTLGPRVFDSPYPNTWAPDVYRHSDGKFYLYYTGDFQIGVAVADRPDGRFVDRGILVRGAIDAHLFPGDDGRLYLLYVQVPGFRIHVQPMASPLAADKTRPAVKVLEPTEPWEKAQGHVTEGPWILRHRMDATSPARYLLIYSGSGADGPEYAVGYAVSDRPTGPYKKYPGNPIIRRGPGVFGPGHGCVVPDGAGRLWHVYHQKVNDHRGWPRFICIDPLEFDAQGNLHGRATRGTPQAAPTPQR